MIAVVLSVMFQAPALPAETWKERNRPDMPTLPACELSAGTRSVAALRELPTPVAAELMRVFESVGSLAEAGGPYNSTDVTDGRLPSRRFLRAYETGRHWIVWYERGGLTFAIQTIALRPDGIAYRALPGTTLAGDPCHATKAILAGVRVGSP